MKAESCGPFAPAMAFKSSSTPTTFEDHYDLLPTFVHDNAVDLTLDLTLMPQFLTADSPASSLSTPTTQTSFEDSQSSAPSSISYTTAPSFSTDRAYFDTFVGNSASPFFDGSLFLPSPFVDVKQEPGFFTSQFEPFCDMSYVPFEFKPLDSTVHRSIEMPASPQQLTLPTFSPVESYERTIPATTRPYQPTLPTFPGSYSSSSEETMSEAPLPSPLPKKPARVSKQDKGIKCDHCGVDKTPLWRKVPNKENAYHW
jgi:hypothetical protein